jgi:proliferating cell nuclear antigen
MFNATLSNTKILKDSIDTISQIIDEVSLKINSEGLEIVAADRAMVTVIDFKLGKKVFDEYECSEEHSIGINLISFMNLLKRCGSDKLNLKLNDEKNRFELFFSGDSVRAFTLPVLDISSEDVPDINKFDFPTKAQIRSDIIVKGVEDADVIAESVGMELGSKGFRMFAEGTSSKSELKLDGSAAGIMNIQATDLVKSKYPIDYMKKVMKAGKLVDTTWLSMGNDYPLKLEFAGDGVSLSFIVAPRVSED